MNPEIENIFSELSEHMIQGNMVHEQLMNCYLFLGLNGYSKCHEYHYLSETLARNKLVKYSIEHYGIIVKDSLIKPVKVIPETWYGTLRDSVDLQIRRKAIASAYDEWITWEESAKKLYEDTYVKFFTMGDIAGAEFIKGYILDVEEELVEATNDKLKKESMGYDIVSIIEEQDKLEKEFERKIKKLIK